MATPRAPRRHQAGEFELRALRSGGWLRHRLPGFVLRAAECEVAIKEYMPTSLAARTATRTWLFSTSPGNAETFALGLKSFVNEARLLARFDHGSLIKVHRFWEERGTAYMVMPLTVAAPARRCARPCRARRTRRGCAPSAGAPARRVRGPAPRGRVSPRHRTRQHPDRRRWRARCCWTLAPHATSSVTAARCSPRSSSPAMDPIGKMVNRRA